MFKIITLENDRVNICKQTLENDRVNICKQTLENDRVNICKQTLQFVLEDLGSIFGSTYQSDGMKICLGKTLVVLEVFIRDLPK